MAQTGTVDLWALAEELVVTPEGEDESTRMARRRTGQRRARFRLWLAIGAVCAAGGTAGVLIGSTGPGWWLQPLSVVVGMLGLVVVAGTATMLLRANAYRAMYVWVRGATTPTWWVMTSLSLALTVFASGISVLTLPFLDEEARATGTIQTVTLSAAVFGLLCAVGSSALMPPLLLAADTQRPYQNHWSQVAWTAGLMGLTTCIVLAVLAIVDRPAWVPEVAITVGFALVAATAAWHARALSNLRALRRELLTALQDAIQAVPTDPTGGVAQPALEKSVDALLAIQVLVARDPFRSQSPAASPPPAAWEVTQIVELGLYAAGHAATLPESIASRAHLPGSIGQRFRLVTVLPKHELLTAVRAFLVRGRASLLAGSAAQW